VLIALGYRPTLDRLEAAAALLDAAPVSPST
jgi:hypothetical protein